MRSLAGAKKCLVSVAFIIALTLARAAFTEANAQQPAQTPAPSSSHAQQKPAYDDWSDDFKGDALDESKWERFSFEGAGGGKVEVKDGEVRLRSANGTRAGIRSKPSFTADHFSVEAHLA